MPPREPQVTFHRVPLAADTKKPSAKAVIWLSAAVFVAGLAQVAYGLSQTALLSELRWAPAGISRFLTYAGCYLTTCVWLYFTRRGWLASAMGLGALFVASSAVGLAPLAALLFFIATATVAGDFGQYARYTELDWKASIHCLLRGICLIALVVGIAVHFPVNYRPVYVAVALAVLTWRRGALRAHLSSLGSLFTPAAIASPLRFWTLATTGFVVGAHLLIALKPEAGHDALVTHLAVPAHVADHGFWHFDVTRFVWSAMPMAGAWIYTTSFLLGGEFASRLVNFLFLALTCLLIYQFARLWASRPVAAGAAALFASTPMVYLVTGSLFIENMLACLILAGALAFHKAWRYGRVPDLFSGCIFFGTALATKFGAATYIAGAVAALAVVMLIAWRRKRRLRWWRSQRAAVAIAILVMFGSAPYCYSWYLTGNPFFPFLNHVYKSPLFSAEPFRSPFSPQLGLHDAIYALTFRTNQMLEGHPGAAGLQYLLFFPALGAVLTKPALRASGIPAITAIIATAVILISQPNARYLYPAMALWSPVIGLMVMSVLRQSRWLGLTVVSTSAVVMGLNLYLLPASAHLHPDFAAWSLQGDHLAKEYRSVVTPVRDLVDFLNMRYPGEAVWFLDAPAIAGLKGEPILSNWYRPAFQAEVSQCTEASQLMALTRKYRIGHVVAGADLRNQPPAIRSFLQEHVEKTLEISGVASFRIRPVRQTYRDDLLPEDESATRWKDWQQNGQPKFGPDGAVTVSAVNTLVRGVRVEQGIDYRYSMNVSCAGSPAQFRLQLNWHDEASRFLTTSIDVRNCEREWSQFEKNLTPPPGAAMAVVIVGSHVEGEVNVREVSLKH